MRAVSIHPKLAGKHLAKYLLVYPMAPRMKEFPGLLYQTRQPAQMFRQQGAKHKHAPKSGDAGGDECAHTARANWRGYYTEGRGLARTNSGGL